MEAKDFHQDKCMLCNRFYKVYFESRYRDINNVINVSGRYR